MIWLTSIFTEWKSRDDISQEKIPKSVQAFKVKLTYFMYETFAQNVISQFFSIIIGKLYNIYLWEFLIFQAYSLHAINFVLPLNRIIKTIYLNNSHYIYFLSCSSHLRKIFQTTQILRLP